MFGHALKLSSNAHTVPCYHKKTIQAGEIFVACLLHEHNNVGIISKQTIVVIINDATTTRTGIDIRKSKRKLSIQNDVSLNEEQSLPYPIRKANLEWDLNSRSQKMYCVSRSMLQK